MSELQRSVNPNRKGRKRRRKRKKKEKRSGDLAVTKRQKQGNLEASSMIRCGVQSACKLVEARLQQNKKGFPEKADLLGYWSQE